MKKFIEKFYMAILFILLYAPIFVLMLFSFNDSREPRVLARLYARLVCTDVSG